MNILFSVILFRGIVHPKNFISWKCTHPQAIQDVDNVVSLAEQIRSNLALHDLFTKGSSAVNGCRQNETKQLIKNITIIHK